MRTRFAIGCASALLLVPVAGQAIVWRNDIPESTVLNYGATSRFAGVGRVNIGGSFGTGTFLGVSSSGVAWGLSAKHVIDTGDTGSFTFEDGGNFTISQAIGFAGVDVSVFRINGWNRNVFTPTLNMSSIYTPGTQFDSAGYGGHGAVGSSGSWQFDNKRRGMQTVLNTTRTASFAGENQFQIIDRFDSPSDSGVRPIEGFGAPGDSGSMLLDNNGAIWGVLSGGQFEQYGALNWYAAITPQLATQIYSVTGIDPVPEPATMTVLGLGALALMRRKRAG